MKRARTEAVGVSNDDVLKRRPLGRHDVTRAKRIEVERIGAVDAEQISEQVSGAFAIDVVTPRRQRWRRDRARRGRFGAHPGLPQTIP